MITRRRLLTVGAAGGALAVLPSGRAAAAAAPLLDAHRIPKYVTALPVPGVMPPDHTDRGADEYVIGLRQFRQQMLPQGFPATPVWGYGSLAHPETFGHPACTIEARVGRPVRVTWVNQLVDRRGDYLPHLLPVDPTLHWARPDGGVAGRDHMAHSGTVSRPYTGPVPMVVHLHGGHVREESDGYPEAWYLPVARDLPADYAAYGSSYRQLRSAFAEQCGIRWAPGSATAEYPNDQRATALWYHDHTIGLTRQNLYVGAAGFYLLRGGPADLPAGVLPGPALGGHRTDGPGCGGHASGGRAVREIPLLIQDRTFTVDGRLHYPGSRAEYGDYSGPYRPESDVPPVWNPEVFGRAVTVNGVTWPVLRVERRRYRFRLLNGSNSRFLLLSVATHPTARPARPVLPLWQIGNDGGFLVEPVAREQVLLGNGQRVDVVLDFTDVPVGTELYLVNEGPDGPARGGRPDAADPATTGQVLKFVVDPASGPDVSVPPDQLRLPTLRPLGRADRVRRLALSDRMSTVRDGVLVAAMLGVVRPDGRPVPMRWSDPVSERPTLGDTEIWELHNFTRGVHPIHLHQVQFQVVGRGPTGDRPPEAYEWGFQDTVAVFPGELTRIKARFDLPGRYVWHCHMPEHEDNDMMRPYQVEPARWR
ncbi:multicopper oxidase family protein [Micromonospora cathayae]|uniref:Multicopper oxidase domain-containing protein n=1 Tax=Micromonospora cathayae TaxID=3028804 RepID=A0ABY8A191_9ACTN|nr:multicopper oxidase domain-containing protein [Micromonospora sp. HUAS 3]WDZ87884.1 multicopper oxidase domain-containing protein [Micromonospora sp. HUAS 3]